MRYEFLEYYRKGAMRVTAPDFQICGALSEGKKIVEMTDLHHMLACPHNASSPIGIAAALHACGAILNLQALEFHALPALGIELDEDETRRYALAGEPFFD